MIRIAALILAAGRASRFGGAQSKVLAEVEGVPMVRSVAEAAQGAGLPLYVVTGYQAAQVRTAIGDLKATIIENPDFAQGMSTSLKAGLQALPAGVDAVVVLLADMPKVGAGLIRALADAFRAQPQAPAIVPVYQGERGNPVLVARGLFPAILQLSGDQGARRLLDRTGGVIELPVEDAAVKLDIDTQEALRALKHAGTDPA